MLGKDDHGHRDRDMLPSVPEDHDSFSDSEFA